MAPDGLPEVENSKTNINLAKDWLVNLNNETKETRIIVPNLFEYYVTRQIEKFQTIFLLSKDEQDYLKRILGIMKGLLYRKIDLFLSHGDFCRHNILASKNKTGYNIGVIDWAFSKRANLPLHDFLFFLTTYFLQVRRKNYGITGYIKAFEDTFFNENNYSDLVKQCLTEYCQELKIDLSLTKPFFTMFLIDKAISEYQKLLSISERGFIPGFGIYSESNKNKSYRDAQILV